MIENIDKVLDRGDRLELLVDKTANMQGNTFRFRKQARRFRSTVWWRNVKLTYVLYTTISSYMLTLALGQDSEYHSFLWPHLGAKLLVAKWGRNLLLDDSFKVTLMKV